MADKLLLEDGTGYLTLEDGTGSYLLESNGRLYLRNTTTNGISIGGVPCYDLSTTPGSSPDTAVTDTTNGGTEIQFTKTAGGSVAAFITGRVPAGGWTITSSDVALWLQESASTVNAGLRFRLFKYSGGTETELGGSPFDKGTEFNTGTTLETLVGNVTDTALAEDDRLLLRIYAVNVGTMAVGTVTLNFNGAVGVGGAPSYSLVQTASGVGSSATATVTLGSAPTVGNLLVAHYFTRAATATPPAGWTLAVQSFNATENDSVNVYYRIVQSGDGTSYIWGDGTDDELVRISEWSCSTGWPANPVDKTATTGRTTATSSLSSGTTATTTQADELSIAAVGLRNIVANTPNYTNSFTGQALVTGGTNTSTLFPAYKIETATGAKETTVSWSGGADTAIGCIATFMGNAGAAADSYIYVYPDVEFKAESGGSAQNLTAPLTTNSQTFYPASVSAGAASVTPPLLTNNQSFPAATVNRGAVGVTAPLVSNSNTVFEPVVIKGAVDLLPPVLGSSLAVYSPTVSVGVVEIAPPLVTNTQSFHSPVVSSGQVLFPELLVNSQVFYAPTVIRNDAELQPPLLVNNQSFYTPTVAAGGNDVVAPLVTNTNTVFAPSITIENHIAAPLVVNTNTVFAPATSLAAYQLTAGMVVNSQSFLVPTITTSVDVVAGLVSNNQTFFGASIATGATTIVPQRVSNQQTFFIPTVTGGVQLDVDGGFYSAFERRRRREQKRR